MIFARQPLKNFTLKRPIPYPVFLFIAIDFIQRTRGAVRSFLLILLLFSTVTSGPAATFDFYRQSGESPGPTLLVIGGVDGDEPGGFHAAATLLTRYQINRGHLWIVPNLSFRDILERQRGRMNLQFSAAPPEARYAEDVAAIKGIMTRPQVDLILNLHDGSGFYHPKRVDKTRHPGRWGQSCVIDQAFVPGAAYSDLKSLVENAIAGVNRAIPSGAPAFRLKNVATASAAREMPARKSLSFFAVNSGKAAVAVEASKTHPVHLRTYYHLLALESFMAQMQIDFSRDFPLTPDGVGQVIREDALISLAAGRIQLELNNMRPELKNFPLPEPRTPSFSALNPLITLQPEDDRLRIHYGNNRLAVLQPRRYPLDTSISEIGMTIDGRELNVPFGSIIPVSREFKVNSGSRHRVNVVGFAEAGRTDDAHASIGRAQLDRTYSVDKGGQVYRVEVYRDKRFSGMVLVDFRPRGTAKGPLVARTSRNHAVKIEKPN